jgi:hypothetical protein
MEKKTTVAAAKAELAIDRACLDEEMEAVTQNREKYNEHCRHIR